MALGSRVRRKNLVIILLSMTFTLGILAVTMLFSSRAENMELQDMAGMIRGAVEQVNGMYPLTGLYTAGITGANPAALAGFAGHIHGDFPPVHRIGAVEVCTDKQCAAYA